MFGEVAAGYEQNAAGGYEIVERFAKFVNVPELMKRVRNFMDVLTSDQLGDLVKRPNWKAACRKSEVVPASDRLERYMKGDPSDAPRNEPEVEAVKGAAGQSRSGHQHHHRRAAERDRHALRAPAPEGRSGLEAQQDDRQHHRHPQGDGGQRLYRSGKTGAKRPEKGGVQIVFSAVGFGEQAMKNRGFDVRGWVEKRLTEGGIKKSEIAWMSDANTHAKKDALQKDVRSGKVRVLIGSPKNMGTGLNVQRRLYALHFLSPPWYPSDVEQPHGRIIRQGNLHRSGRLLVRDQGHL
jgi:hypothetical protein